MKPANRHMEGIYYTHWHTFHTTNHTSDSAPDTGNILNNDRYELEAYQFGATCSHLKLES